MKTKALFKYQVILVFLASFFFSINNSSAQKIDIPISSEYEKPLYSIFFTSSNSFLATTYEKEQEYIRKFSFENGLIKDNGLAILDSGVAIGGQINGLPYLYLQHSGDVIPGYPDDSPFSFTSYNEEVFVAGYLENQLVVVNQNGRLNLCEVLETKYGDNIRYERINISDPKKNENGVFIIGDSLYFSRIDDSGYYKLYKSVYDSEKKAWRDPIIMSSPYNIEGTNTLFYVWYEGVEYVSSDRGGILTIYAIGSERMLQEKFNNKNLIEKQKDDYAHMLRMKIRDKVYEEYVSSNNYGFYNMTIDLTDSIHIVKDGDIIFILEMPEIDIRGEVIHMVGSLTNKENRSDLFMAKNITTGERFTLISVDFAKRNGLPVGKNIIKKSNLNKEDKKLLNNINYAVYNHSLVAPGYLDFASSGFNTNKRAVEDLYEAIRSKKEFTESELLSIFGLNNNACYVQVGFYKNRQPNRMFWSIFQNKYSVVATDRIVKGRKVGTQYTINLPLDEAFLALSYTVNGFKKKSISDIPFIRIGKWDRNYTIIKLLNDKYVIQ